jgi:olfactory receptor
MAEENYSTVTEFILAGLSEKEVLQLPLFFFFLGIYVLTVVGNLGMMTLILSSHLHTPMYFFPTSLSFIHLCHSTVITPKMLVSFVKKKNIISYPECMTELYFFLVFAYQNVTCWLQWPMTFLLLSVTPCFTMSPCPIKSVHGW